MIRVAARSAASAARSIGLGAIFVSALAAGVVLHADLAAARRLVASKTNDALASVFQGRVVIGQVTSLTLGRKGHLRVAEVRVLDPEDHEVLVVKDIAAEIDLARLVASIRNGKPPDIQIESLRIDDVDVTLDVDAAGQPKIARAFATRPPKGPPAAPAPPSGEGVRLAIPLAQIQRGRVHGNIVPPALDADASELVVTVTVANNELKVVLTRVLATVRSPRGPGQSGPIKGHAKGELVVPLREGEPALHLTLDDGDLAGIPFHARADLENGSVVAAVDVPAVAPDVVKRAFPDAPLTQPAELHVAARGVLPQLKLTARARAGTGELRAEGEIGLAGRQPFRLDADLSHIDASAFGGPSTDVSGAAHAEGEIAGGAPTGRFRASTKPGVVASEKSPALDAEGTFDARGVSARLRASEPGLDVEGKVDLHAGSKTLAFDVRARSKDLHAVTRAPGIASGSATAHATGRVDLERGTVVGHVSADGENIAKGSFQSAKVHADATVAGPVTGPVLDVTADAEDVRLTAEGKAPLVYPRAKARARVGLVPTPRITDAEVRVEARDDEDGATSVVARASEIRIEKDGSVVVQGGRVTGLGAPLDVDAHVGGRGISVRARGADVDMRRAATMTGIDELRLLPEGSRASFDVELGSDARGAHTQGHVDLVVKADGGYAGELHAAVKDDHVTARGRVEAGAMGWVDVTSAELDLPGPPSASTIARAIGTVDLSGEIDLSQGGALFAGERFEQISGALSFSARVERGDPALPPRVAMSARTSNLDVTLAAPEGRGESTRITGIDGLFHVAYDGATDDTEVSLLAWDRNNLLASADAKSRVPVADWVTGKRPFERSALGRLEAIAVVDVPRRVIADLPGSFAGPDLRGAVSAHLEATGSLSEPHVSLVARAEDLRERERRGDDARYSPVDAAVQARWDGDRVVAALGIDDRDADHKRGHVRGLVLGRLDTKHLLTTGDVPWNASAELDVKDLALAPLPIPGNVRNVQGTLTSRVRLRDLNGEPSLEGEAHVTGLSVANAPVGSGDVKIEARNESLAAHVKIHQAEGGDASFDIASRALLWQGTSLDWDDARNTRVDYTFSAIRLAMLRPIVRRQIPEIDGRLDGTGSATIDAEHHVFEGGLALSGGRMYVNAIGEEVTDINAVARFERNGVFRIQDASGRVGAGELKASASGRMNGLHFGSAEATIVVPSKDGVPISSEGATFAEATGEVRIAAKMSEDRKQLLVAVAVPRARIELPDRDTQQLQSLDPDEAIAVGIRKPDGTLAPEVRASRGAAAASAKSAEQLLARFAVTLGDDVQLEGRGLSLYLTGRTLVDIAHEIAVTGQISLKSGGTIKVQGRKFVIDRGTASFNDDEDPSNPVVLAAAYWDAPDRTRVWVEFSGPIKTGKLTLRSEPPYTKNEILSILLFGRPDPNAATGGNRATGEAAASAVSGGFAAAGLNQALSELSDDVDLEQDRTSSNRVRTKVGYRLRRNLKVQLGYASGFSVREPDTTFLFLEWQFVPKWSLIGTRGDRGTSILDVIFQHRY